ncbi:toxin-antitoxin system HicB family antitoxin [Clostridiaceae bacterium HSG29]|nr:toxin-antitoxin system HicB family antitoxin [Clostridiaceae bacterium HSG29]
MKKNIKYYLSLKYPLVVKEDDGSYYAEYPDLKGCMTIGNSLSEISEAIKDAKQAWIETAIENNIKIPEPKSENDFSGSFRIRMPKSLHKSLSDDAKNEGISMNQYCIYLLSKAQEREHNVNK